MTFIGMSNSNVENVDSLFLKWLEYDCHKVITTAVFSAYAILTAVVIGLAACSIAKDRRRRKLKRLKESGIEQYRTTRKKYVVFLSFSGGDEEFVMTRAYPQLDAELKHILNTESVCVATSDQVIQYKMR